MSRTALLRLADLRAVHDLTAECRDLGDDPGGWRRHWFRGVARLTGADLGVGGEKSLPRVGTPVHLGAADWGFENGFDPTGWVEAIKEFHRDPNYSPAEQRYLARLRRDPGAVHTRADVMADRGWYRSANYQGIQRVIGVDHTMWTYRFVRGGRDEVNGLILCRAAGRRDFGPRDRAVAREAHAAVGPLVGGPLARFADPSPAALPPRVRQVLRSLLEGDSDKQTAARFGLTRHTVNGYAKVVFRYFGVTTRAELLARWVRRGWGNKCAWAE